MKFLLAIGVGFGLVVWDAFKNDGAWIGFAIAEIDRALFILGF